MGTAQNPSPKDAVADAKTLLRDIFFSNEEEANCSAAHATRRHHGFEKEVEWSYTTPKEANDKMTELNIKEFMEAFISGHDMNASQLGQIGNFSNIDWSDLNTDTYPTFITIFNQVLQLAGSKDRFFDTACWEDGTEDLNPSLVWERPPPDGFSKEDTAFLQEKSTVHRDRIPYIKRVAWAWVVLAVEIKTNEAETHSNPEANNEDYYGSISCSATTSRSACGQHARYARQIQNCQHRTHTVTLSVAEDGARFHRWDCSGCVVSTPISLVKDRDLFLNCLYRIARGGRDLQGYDPTAQLASPRDLAPLKAYTPGNRFLTGYHRHMLDYQEDYPVYKIVCDIFTWSCSSTQDTVIRPPQQSRTFLIGRPVSAPSSIDGRCTKGFVGFDLQEKRLCFIKDVWRPTGDSFRPEWEVYERLCNRAVDKYVAAAIAGGDVSGPQGLQHTVTQSYSESSSTNPTPVQRIHSRLVLRDVGRPLDSCESSILMIRIVLQALSGHQLAWERAGVLHNDVSVGNIMLDAEAPPNRPRGFLTDWDSCKYEEDLAQSGSSYAEPRSGTFPFMAASALQYPRKPIELADDLESFVYVVLHMALRWYKHEMSPPSVVADLPEKELTNVNGNNKSLALRVYNLFCESWDCVNGYQGGGNFKMLSITCDVVPVVLKDGPDGQPTPLALLLSRLYELLHEHYSSLDLEALRKFSVQRLFWGEDNEERLKPKKAEELPSAPTPEWPKFIDASDLGARTRTRETKAAPPDLKNFKPVLSDHRHIVQAFNLVFTDERGQKRLGVPNFRKPDKFVDQFLGFQAVLGVAPRRYSTKRSMECDVGFEPVSKKRKTAAAALNVDHNVRAPPSQRIPLSESSVAEEA